MDKRVLITIGLMVLIIMMSFGLMLTSGPPTCSEVGAECHEEVQCPAGLSLVDATCKVGVCCIETPED
ncbi:MAG: hypothetical protein GY861_07370 [bacterium]|nr:hypothetical protein [bacterium]